MKAPTWLLAVFFIAMSIACVEMILQSTRRLAFDTPEEQRRFWVSRYLEQLPRPDKTTVLNIYRFRPVTELMETFSTKDVGQMIAARELLWNLWAQDLGPANESLLNEAVLMNEDGLSTQALALAKVLVRAAPQHAEPYSIRGRLYFELGKYQKGLADCRKALELNPMHWPSLSLIANHSWRFGEFETARQAVEALKRIFPHDPEIQRQLESFPKSSGSENNEKEAA